jgi:hypothetical protein
MSETRTVRQSPSGRRLGKLGFARLSLSAPAAFADGVALQIPFDVIDDMSEGFGELVTGGVATAPGAFRLTEAGVYLIQSFFVYDAFGTSIEAALFAGTTPLAAVQMYDATPLSMSLVGNAMLTVVTPDPAGDLATIIEAFGTGGNIDLANCLITQVG